jgi:putative flippase GtrA
MDFLKFFKFGLVGCTGLIVDFSITWFCKEKLLINKYLSNSFGFTFGVINNYFLNKYFTFQNQDTHISSQFLTFLMVSVVGFGLNTLFLYLLQKKTKINFYLCKGIVTGIVFFWNFGANTLYTFRT